MTTMTQCSLERRGTTQIAWIPTKLAHHGFLLKIRGVDGWLVKHVWRTMATEEVRSSLPKAATHPA